MHQAPNEPSPKPASQDAEEADGKAVRGMPRRRLSTERDPDPPTHDDADPPRRQAPHHPDSSHPVQHFRSFTDGLLKR